MIQSAAIRCITNRFLLTQPSPPFSSFFLDANICFVRFGLCFFFSCAKVIYMRNDLHMKHTERLRRKFFLRTISVWNQIDLRKCRIQTDEKKILCYSQVVVRLLLTRHNK